MTEAKSLRDESGRWIPGDYEKEQMRKAAVRDADLPVSFRGESPRDWVFRAAGADPRAWTDHAAVEADLAERRNAGLPAGPDVKAQLEVAHSHARDAWLDFTMDVHDPGTGERRTVTDYNKLEAFRKRLEREVAVRTMGPGSGMARGDHGDPAVVAELRRAAEEKARLLAAARAIQNGRMGPLNNTVA